MNTRRFHLVAILLLMLALFYQYSSEQEIVSQEEQLDIAKVDEERRVVSSVDGDLVYLENDVLTLLVRVEDGSIVEARSKKHLVQNVVGSLGVRIFGQDAATGFKYYFK